jgi:hypothetical protein
MCGTHLEVCDDIILDRLIVESVHQDFIPIASIDGIRNASDEAKQFVGKVLVEIGLEASLVKNV